MPEVPEKPLVILWRTATPGIILETLTGSTTVDKNLRKHRCYFRPWIPYAAIAWTPLVRGGLVKEEEWRPLSELPPEWGLGTAVMPMPSEEEELEEELERRYRSRRRRR